MGNKRPNRFFSEEERERLRKMFSLGREKFIEKAIKKHGNTYDYSLVEYKNGQTVVKIICPIHSVFLQSPFSHAQGAGCKKCATERSVKVCKNTTEWFINKSKECHATVYDYSLAVYKNGHTRVKIICPVHGLFEQRAYDHAGGQDCPSCTREKTTSKNETHLKENIKSTFPGLELKPNYREHPELNGLEVDIWLPEIGLAIEWNGIYWHSRINTKKYDEFKKKKLGEDLIQIIDPGGEDVALVKAVFEKTVLPEIRKRQGIPQQKP
jgi:hypothetical protein